MARNVKNPEDRKLEIILTAEKLFSERAFKKTSIDAITQEMGVAKGTFYYYFKSKDAVLEAIVNRIQTPDCLLYVSNPHPVGLLLRGRKAQPLYSSWSACSASCSSWPP